MLDERQIKCCELISKGMMITDVAKEVGISRTTIYQWKKLEEFNAEIDRMQQEFISQAQGRLKAAAKDAADILLDLMRNGKYEKTKLSAAIDVLDRNLGKATSKIEVDDTRKQSTITAEQLEQELEEFSKEFSKE